MLPNRSHDNVDADDVMMKGMGRGSQDISDCLHVKPLNLSDMATRIRFT